MIQAHGVLFASILATRTFSLYASRSVGSSTKPDRNRTQKGCYVAFMPGGERVTISNSVQSITNVIFVPFCFRLSIASGESRGQDRAHGQQTPTP